jgi:hypothetical protein
LVRTTDTLRRLCLSALLAIGVAALAAACSGSGPMSPSPPSGGGGGTPTPPTPPPNNLPVIDSIAIQGTRSPKEPPNFADLGETVNVTAKVHDDETAADQLEYQWAASVGTINGTGASATWQAPRSAATIPMDVTITLKVVERYGFPGQPPAYSHDVTGTQTLSLHDSINEVGTMARQFLLDFSDSSITDVPYIMRNFDLSCREAQSEAQQVTDNRHDLKIVKWNIGTPRVTLPFGNAICPIPGRSQRGDACSATPSHWESTIKSNGHYTIADGDDWINAFYHADLKAWKLCDSQFPGTCFDVTAGKDCSQVPAAAAVVPDSIRRRIELRQ